MDLKLEMRQQQYYNLKGDPITYQGPNPASLNSVVGPVKKGKWQDFTNDVANLDEITLEWTLDRDTNGQATVGVLGSLQVKRTSSGTLQIEGKGYLFIKEWLVDDVAAPLNAIEVHIIDTSCGTFEKYSITSRQIRWSQNTTDDDMCYYEVTLQQMDESLQCIQKTLVDDNWQGWFQEKPAGGKKHPRFSYCNEARPNALIVVQWYLMSVLFPLIVLVMLAFSIVGTIIDIVWSIISAIVSAISALGGGSISMGYKKPLPDLTDFNDMLDGFFDMYVESAGCGREHPAPLIRDYIQNVCAKCGIQVDSVTAPIFFDPSITLTSASRGKVTQNNPHYNACYFNAPMRRGIRRSVDSDTFYIPENSPLKSLDMMLDDLKDVYNAEWRLKGGKLYFWRKDWFLNGGYVYDFTDGSPDRLKILEGMQFEWNEVQYPSYIKGLYTMDAADTCGNEALTQMNGYISIGNVDTNPLFGDNPLDKTTKFGGTKFRLDGAATDYIYDAMQVVANFQLVALYVEAILRKVDTEMASVANYALLMSDEICTAPKILIWDGNSFLNAKCVNKMVPYNNSLVPIEPIPVPNPNYLPPYPTDWASRHIPQNRVLGSALTPGGASTGIYRCSDYFGSLIANNAARLVNYPMYFEPYYQDTLFDLYHWIDDPRRNPSSNLNWSVKIDYCCEDLQRLKAMGDAQDIVLGDKVKVPQPFYPDGVIKTVRISHSSKDKLGKYIEIKGTA